MTKDHAQDSRSRLRAAGLRATGARLAVLRLLESAQRPITHGEVVDRLRDEPWDRATLYRNLIDLSDAGLARRVSLGSTWHFEGVAQGGELRSDHPHFVCTVCGDVACARGVRMTISADASSAHAIRTGQVEVQLHGQCNRCEGTAR